MPPTAALSLGKKLEWANAVPTLVQVEGLVSLEISYGDRAVIDASDLGTVKTATQPKLYGLRDADKISFRGKWDKDDTVHAALLADFKAATPRQVRYTRTDATPSTATWTTGVVTSFQEPDGTKDSPAMFSGVITCDGAPTEA